MPKAARLSLGGGIITGVGVLMLRSLGVIDPLQLDPNAAWLPCWVLEVVLAGLATAGRLWAIAGAPKMCTISLGTDMLDMQPVHIELS